MHKQNPKILFIADGRSADYQCDVVFHGLKVLFGRGVEETGHAYYMYSDVNRKRLDALYGHGFTLYGRIPPSGRHLARLNWVFPGLLSRKPNSSRFFLRARKELNARPWGNSSLRRRIKSRKFDAVVFGSIWRCNHYLNEVLEYYPPERVAFVDGEDHAEVREELLGRGLYFKREHQVSMTGVFPINFGIPKDLVVGDIPGKKRDWATVQPGKPETYVFDRESDYFDDYQRSKYGLTVKKAGWDCLRHYEILMNGCLTFFPGIESCPDLTMSTFPKTIIAESNRLVYSGEMSWPQYRDVVRHLSSILAQL
jgi:hypothetical protein